MARRRVDVRLASAALALTALAGCADQPFMTAPKVSPSQAATAQVNDATPPTIATIDGPQTVGDRERFGLGTPAQTFSFAVNDNVGFGPLPVYGLLYRYRRQPDTPNGTPVIECAVRLAADGVSPVYTNLSNQPDGNCPMIALPASFRLTGNTNDQSVYGTQISAQYALAARARDAAGNLSGPVYINTMVDRAAPATPSAVVPSSLDGNQPETFTVSTSENLDLESVGMLMQYGTAFGIRYPDQTVGTPFDGTLTNGGGYSFTVPQFIRSITYVNAAVPPNSAPVAASAALLTAVDASYNLSSSTRTFSAGTVRNVPTTPVFATSSDVTNLRYMTFGTYDPSNTSNNNNMTNPTIAAAPRAGQYRIVTLGVNQLGVYNKYVSQFQRLELYVRTGTGSSGAPHYRLAGVFPPPVVTELQSQYTRLVRHEMSLTYSSFPLIAPPLSGLTTYELRVMGVTANGDALVSDPINVTLSSS